jgi:hypothetical protein
MFVSRILWVTDVGRTSTNRTAERENTKRPTLMTETYTVGIDDLFYESEDIEVEN